MSDEREKVTIEDSEVGTLDPASFEGPDLQNLWEGQIDDQEVKQIESELLLPEGWYTTVPGPFKRRDELDDRSNNRPVAAFFGRIVKYDNETHANTLDPATGKEIFGSQGYRISTARRNKITEENGVKVDTGKPDFKSNLYVQAIAAYTAAYDERPTEKKQVIDFLTDFPHQVRVVKTQDSRNMIVSIRAVPKEQ